MYCGIDVSKGKSNVCIINREKEVIAQFEIEHNKEGFARLEQHLTKEAKIGMEITGNYSKTLYSYLKEKYDVCYVNNLQMKNLAKLHSPTIKNDVIDAKLIAVFLSMGLKEVCPIKENELKDLCKLYQKVIKQLSCYKFMFQDQLNIIFPELEKEFSMGSVKGIGQLLLKYPTPHLISTTPLDELHKVITDKLKSGPRLNIEKTRKIQELASISIGVKDYPVSCFVYTIRIMLFYQYLLDDIKKKMKMCLKKTLYYKLINEFGYSSTSLSTIVGEVGDIRRFPSHKHFVSYCGFDTTQTQSGTSIRKKQYITKQGNSLLRLTFYMLVLTHIGHKTPIYDFYKRLRDKGKHGKVCVVAAARKLAIKCYYDMSKCHKEE